MRQSRLNVTGCRPATPVRMRAGGPVRTGMATAVWVNAAAISPRAASSTWDLRVAYFVLGPHRADATAAAVAGVTARGPNAIIRLSRCLTGSSCERAPRSSRPVPWSPSLVHQRLLRAAPRPPTRRTTPFAFSSAGSSSRSTRGPSRVSPSSAIVVRARSATVTRWTGSRRSSRATAARTPNGSSTSTPPRSRLSEPRNRRTARPSRPAAQPPRATRRAPEEAASVEIAAARVSTPTRSPSPIHGSVR